MEQDKGVKGTSASSSGAGAATKMGHVRSRSARGDRSAEGHTASDSGVRIRTQVHLTKSGL